MRVGIYGPYFGTLGGGELYLGTIAEILSRNHEVELISEAAIPIDQIHTFFGLELSNVKVRKIDPVPYVESLLPHRLPQYRQRTQFTGEYDLFIIMPRNFRIPFRILARKKILHLQVPDRPWTRKGGFFSGIRNELAKALFYPGIYAGFDAILINSKFHASVIQGRLKNPNARVLPPPVQMRSASSWVSKKKLILGVGRFFRGLHSKRQDVLIDAFRSLASTESGWRLALAGGLAGDDAAQQYFRQLQESAAGVAVEFYPNTSLNQLDELYRSASFFWHAAGFGATEESPEQMEHFGIATVEAMSAGVVPIVYRGGGQLEIIEESSDGFFWNREQELIEKTRDSIKAGNAMERISKAAVGKSKGFGKEAFARKLLEVIDSLTRETSTS